MKRLLQIGLLTLLSILFSTSTVWAQSFVLIYDPPAQGMEAATELISSSGVMEQIVFDLDNLFQLPVTIPIRFTSSDLGPHYYEGEVVMTYEFIYESDQLLASAGYSETVDGQIHALLSLAEFTIYPD